MEDDGLLKTKTTRKKAILTDEKRAELAVRMREINDKRILESASKIRAKENSSHSIDVIPITSPEEKPEAKPEALPIVPERKKRVIQIVQLESDDEEVVELVLPKPKQKATNKEVPTPNPKAKPKPKAKPDEPPKQQAQVQAQAPMVRCKFL